MKRTLLIFAVCVVWCCGQPTEPIPPAASARLVGEWRSVLMSPGGELPFGLSFNNQDGTLTALIKNGEEEVPTSGVQFDGADVVLEMVWYDSRLEGRLSGNGDRIEGVWRKTVPGGVAELAWVATKGHADRFRPLEELGLEGANAQTVPDVSGRWRVLFSDDTSEEVAEGVFVQDGGQVTGTFLTPTGDYRFLDGSYETGRLRLSAFDGAHAFLFDATMSDDDRLVGEFFSRDSYHATWTGERLDSEQSVMPDPWEQVRPTRADLQFTFSFPDLNGVMVANDDARFVGKVLVIELFGSWCPNCNDAASLLTTWHRRWSRQGLEVVGIAFEFSGDAERDGNVLRHYADRHDIEYPLLLAGTSDKTAASRLVPDISAVLSYPTIIFMGRDGRIRWVYSGFSGPGTGARHQQMVELMESRLLELLSETIEHTEGQLKP